MKKTRLILLLLSIFSIVNCASDDDVRMKDAKLYKKSETFINGNLVLEKTVNYNSENKILSISSIKSSNDSDIYDVNYTDSNISSITNSKTINDETVSITYTVTRDDKKIILANDNFTGLEIYHSNNYVDSINVHNPSSTSYQRPIHIYTRDANQNLIANTFNGSTITYSNFDFEKQIDPLNSVIRTRFSDYIRIFNLMITSNNPKVISFSSGTSNSRNLEYDNLGYVIRTVSVQSGTNDYSEHQYEEL